MSEDIGHVAWWARMYKQVALMFAVQAEIEGMRAFNAERIQNGCTPGYDEASFGIKAGELRAIADELGQI